MARMDILGATAPKWILNTVEISFFFLTFFSSLADVCVEKGGGLSPLAPPTPRMYERPLMATARCPHGTVNKAVRDTERGAKKRNRERQIEK